MLTFLPDSLAHCQALTHLIVGKNRFVSLPKVIGELVNLRFLDAYDNRIVEIPYWLGHLKMVRGISQLFVFG
jgi:CCR4-NOT transcription complex subunit 6